MSIPTVLFLCTGNSCRSQMAEGWAHELLGDQYTPLSAGTNPHGLNPNAVKVMAEVGVDISGQTSDHIDDLPPADYVITVCGHAHENCPVLPGHTRVLHVGFDDPPKLAEGAATEEEEALQHYRRVRDEIREMVAGLPQRLAALTG